MLALNEYADSALEFAALTTIRQNLIMPLVVVVWRLTARDWRLGRDVKRGWLCINTSFID